MVVSDLSAYGGSRELIEVLSSTGWKQFYPAQAMAIKAGLLQGVDSFVVSAPTAAGKTLIAEMAALKLHLEKAGRIIYTVPLRALAREKFEDLTKKYSRVGMKIAQSTGDYDRADPSLREVDLIISTNEKMDSLIRHHAPWLKDVNLVVADEIHLMGDVRRGPTLEIVLTRLKWMNPKLRFIALSATIPNAHQIARWLGAKLISSVWRPVPLREGVYFDEAVIFNDGEVKWVRRESRTDAVDLALATIREGGQALIFVNTRKATETTALRAAGHMAQLLSSLEQDALKRLSHDAKAASSEPTRLDNKLAETVAGGVAFHHAGVNPSQRRLIEDAFRANKLKLVVATTTLAMGLNLPSRRVIIRDWQRYESGTGMIPIPVMEIKQMSGRAGRPGLDEYGESVLIARSKKDEQYLFNNYIKGAPEEIRSRLGSESAIRTHVLASIAGGFTRSREDLKYFLAHTFIAQQRDPGYLLSITDDIVGFLRLKGMVEGDEVLIASRFGHRVSELYIDPLSGVLIRDALQMKKDKEAFSLLHMVALTPDMMVLQLKRNDIDEMLGLFHANIEKLLMTSQEKQPTEATLAQIKTAWALLQWIQETPEDDIVGRFDIGPGDLHALVELADWLLYSASEIARIFGFQEEGKIISRLRTRVLYGVKEELLPLVSLRNIGRIRARNLFKAGYKNQKEIRKATGEELSKVPAIGKAIADDIKRQVKMPEKGNAETADP